MGLDFHQNNKINLLLTGCFKYTQTQLGQLQELGFNIYYMESEKYDSLPLEPAKVEVIVCNFLFTVQSFYQFKNLKLIQLTSAGLDRVPVQAIKDSGCLLYNARGVYSIPMAEWALFRVLEHYKQGWFFKNEQDSLRWTKHRGLREMTNSRVAIVGAGNVGQEVARRFHAMGCKTIGFDIHTNPTDGFDEMMLTTSLCKAVDSMDVVIVTAPLLPSTKGLISREVMLAMKKNSVIVNIARGGLIDQEAFIEVFSDRKDLFAALDVFEEEPLSPDSPLWKMGNVAVSPHNSFVSNRNNERMFNVIYNNLKNFITNK